MLTYVKSFSFLQKYTAEKTHTSNTNAQASSLHLPNM